MAPASLQGVLRVDPRPMLASCGNAAIEYFAGRDLLARKVGPASVLWELPEPRRILAKQQPDGSWRYPGGERDAASRAKYDQLETFRQAGTLVEKFGFTRAHPAIARAASFLFSFQTAEGDFRGIYGNQYAPTYVGAIMEVLIRAGFAHDPRIGDAFRWLIATRQSDGGWAIPLRTAGVPFARFFEMGPDSEPVGADPTQPSSHLVTGMVLRAFAAHPARRRSATARRAGALLSSRLYRRDVYGDRGGAGYWERVSFPFWFTDVVSALDTLSRLGFARETPAIPEALDRLKKLQRPDGTFAFKLLRDKDRDLPLWICLAVCRSLERFRA